MPQLVWDKPEDRAYEIGVDHGVLYVADANNLFKGVVWNGLTRVSKESTRDTEPTYFDGVKIHNFVKLTEFRGSLSAITYPIEFEELEGASDLRCGVTLGEQPPGLFGLSYRSLTGDASGNRSGYKLHILYNLQAIPDATEYTTTSDSPELMEFTWALESLPEPTPDHRPTAEITLDSRRVDSLLMDQLETILYGGSESDAYLPPMADLLSLINGWWRLQVLYNESTGQYTVTERIDGSHMSVDIDGTWVIVDADTELVSEGVYLLNEIYCLPPGSDPFITIAVLPGGAWSATTTRLATITIDTDTGVFTIVDATVISEADGRVMITDTSLT
jgi:hypothetical protein